MYEFSIKKLIITTIFTQQPDQKQKLNYRITAKVSLKNQEIINSTKKKLQRTVFDILFSMQITKINSLQFDQHKTKNRTASTSQDKALTVIARRRLQLNSHHADTQLVVRNFHRNDIQQKPQSNNDQINLNQQEIHNFTSHTKKASPQQIIGKDQKESFMNFLEIQMKTQPKDHLSVKSNKLKLPQINLNKHSVTQNSTTEDQTQQQITTPLQPFKPSSTKHSTTTIPRQTPIFMNIKAVIPMQKVISTKKKDYSLRDLRIIKREKQQQHQDFANKQGQENHGIENEKGTRKIGMAKKYTYLKGSYEREGQGKGETGEKRRSQQNSLQKISSVINTRQKRSFSINQNKKRLATTYQDFTTFIASLNKIRLSPSLVVTYRAFVGKGNNSILIKNAIKNRFWWNIVSEKGNLQQINFVWSQQRDGEYLGQCEKGKGEKNGSGNNVDGVKKVRYHLQARPEQKQQPIIRQYTRHGLTRLLSQKQTKQNSFTPLYAQTLPPQSLPQPLDPQKLHLHNHFQFNWNLTNKKALFYNLKTYYQLINQDPFKYIPLTFHVKEVGDKAWGEFKKVYEQRIKQRQNETAVAASQQSTVKKKKRDNKKQKPTLPLWIIKPGQNSNQGCGIQVSDSLEQIIQLVKQKTQTGKNRSSIIQRYLMPFLYCKRKFDIRCYMLVTSVKGVMKGYWYEQGYIRTSSKQFTTKNLKNRMIHLTNDAVQKKGQDYGKYQNGNKISFSDFQKYLDNLGGQRRLSFYKEVYPKMMRLARDALMGTNLVLDANNREFSFQVFGLDFMIDEEFQTWLIEVNNNPCLELSSPLLARIIPNMIENAFKIALDPMFPPPLTIPKSKSLPTDLFDSNKFTLIFNSTDIEEGFKHSITENKVNLDQIVEGEEEDDELIDDEEDGGGCGMVSSGNSNGGKVVGEGEVIRRKNGQDQDVGKK